MEHTKIKAALLAAALALSLTACGQEEAPPQAAEGVAVQVEEVLRDTISSENKVSGKITAGDEAVIMVATSAKCLDVRAEAGDTVKAGDIICTLDLAGSLASYSAAKIGYESAVQSYQDQSAVFDRQVALYQKTVEDLKALFAIGAASQIEIDQAELQLQSAIATRNSTLAQLEAGMQNAKSGMEQLGTALENVDGQGNVIAPISGTLASMNAVEGSFTNNAMPLAVINGAAQMKVQVSVSEALVPKLAIGDEADVTVSAVNKTFPAAIRSVERMANMQTKLYNVTLVVPSDVKGLLSGMFADVTFHTDTSADAIVVPTEAILNDGGTEYVFVVAEDSTARYVEVTTGLTGSGVTEVLSGLNPGDRLVTVGQSYLEQGDLVRVVSGEDEAPAAPEEADAQTAPAEGGEEEPSASGEA